MKDTKGYSTIELVTLIVVIAAAILVMNGYVRRAIMGRLKEGADSLGSQFSISTVKKGGDHMIESDTSIEYTLTVNGLDGTESKNYTKYHQTETVNMELGKLNEEKDFFEE